MKIVPQNNIVLCKCITNNKKTLPSGFVYETNDIDLYEVVAISNNIDDSHIALSIGDVIRVNSTGTLLVDDNKNEFYMFSIDNIIGKIIND